MTLSRRLMIGSAAAVLFGAASRGMRAQGITRRPPPEAQQPPTASALTTQSPRTLPAPQASGQSGPPQCSGTVTLGSKKRIPVRLIGPGPDQDQTLTDDKGAYSLKAPRPGSYTLFVLDPNTNAFVADVSRLTGGITQSVSLTIPDDAKNFVSMLAQLRAVEAAAGHVVGQAPDARSALRDGLSSLSKVVASVRQFVGGLPPEQSQFINEKLRSCEVQLTIAGLS
jgi:hypothetical protein